MPNGYATCPTCGYPPPTPGAWPGPAWGGPEWAGPTWHTGFGGPAYGPGWARGQGRGQGWYYGPGWGAGPTPGYGPAYAPAYYGGLPTDSEIEEMIYDSIDADPLIPFDANVDISVEAGTVYLRGEVPSKRIKHAAGDDAWWIPGVVDVHNEVKVAPKRRPAREGTQPEQA